MRPNASACRSLRSSPHSATIGLLFLAVLPGFPQQHPAEFSLFFMPNHGQARPEVRYLVKSTDLTAYFEAGEASFHSRQAHVRLQFVGGNRKAEIEPIDELAGRAHFLLGDDPGRWATDVPTYRSIAYRDLYPGIDMIYDSLRHRLKSQFVVKPGAAPGVIRLRYEGVERMEVDEHGALVLKTATGELREDAPEIFQEIDANLVHIEGRYLLFEDGTVGFQLGAYDRAGTLVIDPVISYGTYLGGSAGEAATAIAVDSSGNAYVTGWTESTDFPRVNAKQTSSGGGVDVFVAKLNAGGTALVYATYLGGSGDDRGLGIAVDAGGSAYVTGATSSSNFPTFAAARPTLAGGRDAFVAKLSAAGNALLFSTYLGGRGSDSGNGIALDGLGNAYVAGETSSANFPTASALQASAQGKLDAFVAKFSSAGAIVYSTYLGGVGDDRAVGIAVDAAGNAYVTGSTDSTNFPVLNALQPTRGGGQDAFVTKLAADGKSLLYSTYLGGSNGSSSFPESGYGIAVDAAGYAFVAGTTSSTNFPLFGAFQPVPGGGSSDAFVAKLSASGSYLVYSTYLGGASMDAAAALAIDASGVAYITGRTASPNFPTVWPVQASNAGSYDAFVARVNAAGTALGFATYLGGLRADGGAGIAVDTAGNIYVAGQTLSVGFPGTTQTLSGTGDAFIVKLAPSGGCLAAGSVR